MKEGAEEEGSTEEKVECVCRTLLLGLAHGRMPPMGTCPPGPWEDPGDRAGSPPARAAFQFTSYTGASLHYTWKFGFIDMKGLITT